jgi:hypothetical protein
LKLPKHVHGYIDRLGKPRYYYRRARAVAISRRIRILFMATSNLHDFQRTVLFSCFDLINGL